MRNCAAFVPNEGGGFYLNAIVVIASDRNVMAAAPLGLSSSASWAFKMAR